MYMAEKTNVHPRTPDAAERISRICPDAGTPLYIAPPRSDIAFSKAKPARIMRYSSGDRINIKVIDGEDFSGDFVVNADGLLHLPFVKPLRVEGLSNDELQSRVKALLLKAGMFLPDTLRLSVRPVQYAPIQVTVSGSVYRPGRVLINKIRDADKNAPSLAKFGDSPMERFVGSAIRSAGGVRPDADVSAIVLVRAGKRYRLDWRGAFTGGRVDDVPLVSGDHIDVNASPCFQSGLMRPTQMTPDGIRVFVSNLTQPANFDAAAGVSRFAQSLPYGTRLLQGMVSGNCVGGALATNAKRSAVLISTNPRTGRTEVIERSVEKLVRSADRDSINPYLMPDDAIACYDSAITNAREVANTLSLGIGAAIATRGLTK